MSSSNNNPSFDKIQYPRTYRSSLFRIVSDGGLGLVMLLAGVGGLYAHTLGENADFDAFMLSCFFAITLFGLYRVTYIYRGKITLNTDEIIIQTVFGLKSIRRDEIVGMRSWNHKDVKHIDLKLRRTKDKRYEISMPYAVDDAFDAWFKGITNFDEIKIRDDDDDEEEEAVAVVKKSRNGKKPPVTLKDRVFKYAFLFLIFSPFILAPLLLFYPHPYALVVGLVALMPWVAIFVLWIGGSGLSVENKKKSSSNIPLGWAIWAPGIPLMIRALSDVYLVASTSQWQTLAYLSIGGSVLMMLVALILVPAFRKQNTPAFLYAVLLIPYFASVILISNQLLDQSEPTRQSATVLDKIFKSRHKAPNDYKLTIPGLVAGEDTRNVEVEKDFFVSTSIGDSLCISRHPGIFGFEWYSIDKRKPCLTEGMNRISSDPLRSN